VGSGLSCAAGYASWTGLLQGVCDEALRLCPGERTRIASAWNAIEREPIGAAGLLLDVLGTQFPAAVIRQLGKRRKLVARVAAVTEAEQGGGTGPLWDQVGRDEPVEARPTLSHRHVVQMGFRVILTTNYDSLLEDAAPTRPAVYSWRDSDVPDQIAGGLPLILKLHGDGVHPNDIVLARRHYNDEFYTSKTRAAVGALLTSSRPLWIGYGHNDPDLDLLLDTARSFGVSGGFAIVTQLKPILRNRLRDAKIFPIELKLHDDVPRFLQSLARAVDRPASFAAKLRTPWNNVRLANTQSVELGNLLDDFGVDAQPWSAPPGAELVYLEAPARHVALLDALLAERNESLRRRLAAADVCECNWHTIDAPPPAPPITASPTPPPDAAAVASPSPAPQREPTTARRSPDEALHAVLVSCFELAELQVFVHHFVGDTVAAEITFQGSRASVAFEVVAKFKARGLITPALFAALREKRPLRATDIDAVEQRWFPLPTDERYTLFSRLLDRDWAWRALIDGCERSAEPSFFLLHGTPHQGLALFLDRVGRYLDDEDLDGVKRVHQVFEVPFVADDSRAQTVPEWESRLRVALGFPGRKLRDSLARLLAGHALMFVIRGRDSAPLGDMTDIERTALAEFLGDRLPEILASITGQPRALRVLVPMEHAPGPRGVPPIDPLWNAVDAALRRAVSHGVTRIALPELHFPEFHEVEESIQRFLRRRIQGFTGIPADALAACAAIHADHTRLPEPNYRNLADALYRVLDPLLAPSRR